MGVLKSFLKVENSIDSRIRKIRPMNVCSLQIRVITDIFRHAEFVLQLVVVVSSVHVVH